MAHTLLGKVAWIARARVDRTRDFHATFSDNAACAQVSIDNNLTAPGEDSSNVIHADVLMVEPPDGAFETAAGGKGAKPEVPPPKAATAKERGGRGRPKAIDVAAAAAALEANEAGGESDNSTTEKGDLAGPKSDVAEPKEEEEENEKENQVTQPTHDFEIADKDNQVIFFKVFSCRILFLLLLTTSTSTCLKNSRQPGPTF